MPYSIEFQIAGLVFVTILIVIFYSKPRWQSVQNSIFRILLVLTWFELLFDIISVITLAERARVPVLNDFFCKGYLIVMFAWIATSVLYIISNTLYDGIPQKAVRRKQIMGLFIIIAAAVCVIITFIFPLKYAGEGRNVYSYGIPSTCTYLYSVICVIFALACFAVNFRHMTLQKKIPIVTFTLMEGTVAMIQMAFPKLLLIGFGTSVVVFIMYMTMENPDMDMISKLNNANRRTNDLLLNILPSSIARTLQSSSYHSIMEKYDDVTVAFMDIVNFTKLSAAFGPEKIVKVLNAFFSEIDTLLDSFSVEKIKTIGDAYMIAAGVPDRFDDNCAETMRFVIAVQKLITDFNKQHRTQLQLRIGIDSGPVVAGVIGKKKFIYDLWGTTVNYASRMESYGVPGRILVSEAVFSKMKTIYHFERTPPIEIKGCGPCTCYLLAESYYR